MGGRDAGAVYRWSNPGDPDGTIELDPHSTGQRVLTLDEDSAIVLRDTLTEVAGVSAPLLNGAVHLLVADDALVEGHRYGAYIAACGEVVCASSLLAALCPPDCDRDHPYCPACVREAIRWNAEQAGDRASDLDQMVTR